MESTEKIERAELIVRRMLLRDMGFAALLLWIPLELDEKEESAYAYTTGDVIRLCNSFFSLVEAQQMGVVVHEALHVALRHAQRGQKIRARKGEQFSHELLNWCADAVVDRAIQRMSWLGLPYYVTAEKLLDKEILDRIPAHRWTVEMLYDYLEEKIPTVRISIPKNWVADLRSSGTGQRGAHGREMDTRVWVERFRRAVAGSRRVSLLRELSGELHASKTQGECRLRECFTTHLMPQTEPDWHRPSRRLLGSKGALRFFEPGIQRCRGVRRLGAIVDVSGSVDGKVLEAFFGEINRMIEQVAAEVVMISADAEITHIEIFREAIPKGFKVNGGGGTDFRPALEAVRKHDVNCCVYRTDLEGVFPEQPPVFPVLWATVKDLAVPFGRKIVIGVQP